MCAVLSAEEESPIGAAGWAVEGDEELVWAPGGVERERWQAEIVAAMCAKFQHIMLFILKIRVYLTHLLLVVPTKALDPPSKGIKQHRIPVLRLGHFSTLSSSLGLSDPFLGLANQKFPWAKRKKPLPPFAIGKAFQILVMLQGEVAISISSDIKNASSLVHTEIFKNAK